MPDPKDLLDEMLNALGWQQKTGEEIAGFSLIIHSRVTANPTLIGCELLHFGPDQFQHDALHAIAELMDQMIEQEHEQQGMYN